MEIGVGSRRMGGEVPREVRKQEPWAAEISKWKSRGSQLLGAGISGAKQKRTEFPVPREPELRPEEQPASDVTLC